MPFNSQRFAGGGRLLLPVRGLHLLRLRLRIGSGLRHPRGPEDAQGGGLPDVGRAVGPVRNVADLRFEDGVPLEADRGHGR